MLIFSLLTLLPVLVVCSSLSPAQLYLSPATISSSRSSESIELDSQQVNAVLAHHLGVAAYERFPVRHGSKQRDWEEALTTGGWSEAEKLVIVLECDEGGCQDYIPASLQSSMPFTLPSLPLNSWTAIVTLHLHRLAESLETSPAQIWGLESFVQGIKQVQGWGSWVGDELGRAIGWSLKKDIKTTVMPSQPQHSLLGDLDFLDSSADVLITELHSLTELVDSITARRSSNDDGPQGEGVKKIAAIHLKGMKEIAAVHSKSSTQYKAAAQLLQQTLSATIAAYNAVYDNPTIVLLALPPYTAPLLRRRTAWLAPFNPYARYTQRAINSEGHTKRSVGDKRAAKKHIRTPIVPTSSTCFASADAVNNATDSCSGRGVPIAGVSTKSGSKECWVCACSTVEEGGKKTGYAGEGCEKVDLSSDFVLLFFGSFALVVILLASVMLLASVGSEPLPGTLSAMVVGMKRE